MPIQMTNDVGDIRAVPDELTGFMQARGWKPGDAAPAVPEPLVDELELTDEADDADVDVADEVPPPPPGRRGHNRTANPAEEQS